MELFLVVHAPKNLSSMILSVCSRTVFTTVCCFKILNLCLFDLYLARQVIRNMFFLFLFTVVT